MNEGIGAGERRGAVNKWEWQGGDRCGKEGEQWWQEVDVKRRF